MDRSVAAPPRAGADPHAFSRADALRSRSFERGRRAHGRRDLSTRRAGDADRARRARAREGEAAMVSKKHVPAIWELAALRVPNYSYRYLEHAELFPFKPAVIDFDLVNAWWLAEIAFLDYADDPVFVFDQLKSAGFDDVAFFDRDGTHCTVAHRPGAIVVSF